MSDHRFIGLAVADRFRELGATVPGMDLVADPKNGIGAAQGQPSSSSGVTFGEYQVGRGRFRVGRRAQ